jgi:hypothetical protein
MKLAFFGDGTLSETFIRRDGSIGDRRELFRSAVDLGHDPMYLAPPERSAGAEPWLAARVMGWDWRGEVDALIIEVRFAFRPPEVDKADKDPFYHQAVVLRDWDRGMFGDAKVCLLDYDHNIVRLSIGRKTETSHYNTKVWKEQLTPWMEELIQRRLRKEAIVLSPYPPETSPLETRRMSGTYRTELWPWAYLSSYEVPLDHWESKIYDLGYGGSDYNRRMKFWRYFAEPAMAGYRTWVAGVWTNKRLGAEHAPEWNGKNFKDRLLNEVPQLEWKTDRRPLPYAPLTDLLRETRIGVHIVMPKYEELGYMTPRVPETVAAGGCVFVDRDINHHDWVVPDPWYLVGSTEELLEKMAYVKERGLDKAVGPWREHLRALGTGKERIEQLVRIVNGA